MWYTKFRGIFRGSRQRSAALIEEEYSALLYTIDCNYTDPDPKTHRPAKGFFTLQWDGFLKRQDPPVVGCGKRPV